MPTPEKATLACPDCGSQLSVSPAAFSAVCRACGKYLRVQDLLKPARKAPPPAPEQRRITCFDCGAALDVPASAKSTMCKRCSSYIDVQNYTIANAVSKNFKTKGTFIVQPSGYVFNTETIVAEAVIKGRFLGKLQVEGTLTLSSPVEIKGTITAATLIIPSGSKVRLPGTIKVGSADISGELVGQLEAKDAILVRAPGRFWGSIKTRLLTVETGGVLEADARVAAVPPTS